MLSKRRQAKKLRLETQLENKNQALFEAVERLVELRNRFLSIGIALNDPLATNNLLYKQYLRAITDDVVQIEDLEHELKNV